MTGDPRTQTHTQLRKKTGDWQRRVVLRKAKPHVLGSFCLKAGQEIHPRGVMLHGETVDCRAWPIHGVDREGEREC